MKTKFYQNLHSLGGHSSRDHAGKKAAVIHNLLMSQFP